MRRVSLLASFSASLFALAFAGVASASPSVVTRTGTFRPTTTTVSAATNNSVLAVAARDVLDQEIEQSRGLTFGATRIIGLASGDRVVKLGQLHKGVPVVHRGATVTWTGGVARVVSAHLESDLPEDVTPAITSDQASAVAEARSGLPVAEGQVALALWPTADGVKLVWALGAQAIPGIAYQPVVLVDAKTGEIVLVYNAARDLNASQVYPTNPVKSPALADVTLPVGAGETALQNELVQTLNCIDKQTVKDVNFMGFNLQVHVCDLLQTAVPDANGDYLIPPGGDKDPEDAFSEVSMFYHVNRAYTMFRGWDPTLNVNNGPIPTVSNLRLPQGFDTFDLNKIKDPSLPLTPFQNAFFSPANPIFSTVFGLNGGAMWFGQGPLKDYSYDGDVVYHEFTHAVVNATLKLVGTAHMDAYGASQSPGAMNEGLADYFSSALAGDPDVGEYATQDFFPGSKAIRSLNNPDKCPSDVGGEVHQDATMFSGSLWDVRSTLPEADAVKFDGAIFAAMNAAPSGDLGFEDFAKLAITEVTNAFDDAAGQKLSDAFTARGLLPQCTRVLEYTDGTLNGPKALQNLWFAPGTQTTAATAQNGKWTPGVVQMHLTIPSDAAKLSVNIKKVDIGGGGALGGGGTPFTPKFLVRFSKDPINFTYKPLKTADDVMVLDGAANGSVYTLDVDVPAGSTDAYVMVGSTGQTDGAYTAFSASTTPGTIGTGGAGGAGGSTGGGGAGTTTNVDETAKGDGCGCAIPGESKGNGAAVALLAAASLLARGRRRRDRR